MAQEYKQLLLKDLSARLPYEVCVHIRYKTGEPCYGKLTAKDIQWFIDSKIENIKPYLRPMSSMTEEEKYILERLSNCHVQTRVLERDRKGNIKREISYLDNEIKEMDLFGDNDIQYHHISQQNFIDTSDFFNSRHIDYRGLIEKGLALEAPEGMYN